MKFKPLFILFLFQFGAFVYAQNAEKTYNLNKDGVAIEGYDLVSYFEAENPLKGKAENALLYKGATYWFASMANKEKFKSAPENYLPQYGGWCAYAMAKGNQVEINPEAYLIKQEKLYLFYKTSWINTRTKWLKEPKALQAKADLHWAH